MQCFQIDTRVAVVAGYSGINYWCGADWTFAEVRAAIMRLALLFWDNLSFWYVAGGMFLQPDQ